MICFWKNPKIFWAVLCQLGNHWIIWWHINAQMGLVHLQIWATPLLQVMRRHSAQLKENEYLQQSLFSWKSHKSKTEVTITWQVCTSPAVASQHWARCHCDALPPLHAPHPRWKAACSRQGVYQVHRRVYIRLFVSLHCAQFCQETHHLSFNIGVRDEATCLGGLGMSAWNGTSGWARGADVDADADFFLRFWDTC